MKELTRGEIEACTAEADQNQNVYDLLYPSVNFVNYASNSEGEAMLVSGECPALLAPSIVVTTWLTRAENCRMLELETVVQASAGWVINPQSWCVQRAFDWVIQQLHEEGEIARLFRTWLPAASCVDDDDSTTAARARRARRRMQQPASSSSTTVSRAERTTAERRAKRRRLANGSSGATGGAVAASAEGSDDGSNRLGLIEFAGLIIIWLCVTIGMLLTVPFERRVHRRAVAAFLKTEANMKPILACDRGMTRLLDCLFGEREVLGESLDNEAAMLKDLLARVKRIEAVEVARGLIPGELVRSKTSFKEIQIPDRIPPGVQSLEATPANSADDDKNSASDEMYVQPTAVYLHVPRNPSHHLLHTEAHHSQHPQPVPHVM